ncbi:nucleotide sugar dehydrogenase [Arthrobacter sp. H35-D1]|uniref:nucleotide sugar dehydrogenase n=1 Tax=Arthrobacter sp. H35-D1 TaxID=3046202 RepID=UPI0024BB9CCA|nr:nucleotide sugar dehydrogenase [Arthrobacter sp. H35-D1]MDJ0312302.1 nucleotide sugar dehydrogenase [Arthrobacter sp. H35-D1]
MAYNTKEKTHSRVSAAHGPVVQASIVETEWMNDLLGGQVLPLQTDKQFTYDVAIVGLGYVGLPTALAVNASGHKVLGLDVSERRLAVIESLRADLLESDKARLRSALDDPNFVITSDLSLISQAAAVVVCVPTPVDSHLVPELSILRSACASVVENAVAGQLLVLTSTTYVGSTRDMLSGPLAERGLVAGEDIFVAFSPERINPGVETHTHEEVPRVVGGVTETCGRRAEDFLKTLTKEVHVVPTADAAEMTKLVENTFRAVNIALANEFADICRVLNIEVMDVVTAADTKPYGFMAFTPGPGVGGHCIPCDPHYLLWQLRKSRLASPVIESAMAGIAARPQQVIERSRRILSDRDHGLCSARVLIVGVAYKPDVEDLRESPALEIISALTVENADVAYMDHWCRTAPDGNGGVLTTLEDPVGWRPDLVIVHTRHDGVDLSWLKDVPVVLDTTYRLPSAANVFRL